LFQKSEEIVIERTGLYRVSVIRLRIIRRRAVRTLRCSANIRPIPVNVEIVSDEDDLLFETFLDRNAKLIEYRFSLGRTFIRCVHRLRGKRCGEDSQQHE